MTDEQIVLATLSGDIQAFDEIVVKYSQELLSYILRLLNSNQQDGENVLSETFIKSYTNLASFNPVLNFSSWLYRIAYSEAVKAFKKKSPLCNPVQESFELQVVNINFDQPNLKELEALLPKLNIYDRNLLTLFYFQEKPIRQISQILKARENSVAEKLNRVRLKVQKLVGGS